ncbi:MAG: hypothetical protein LGR52_00610 [Candidatus Thiosymbion ectosymbiont of Robbea hypermnestra]|nr:hypothetical protein [Candidatus Thiosymbion ectosymbiont of Robbea hypermnestra]
MTIAVQTCGDPEPDDICERIRGQIRKLVFQTKDECGERGLRERMMDQINGRHGPGTQGWVGHNEAINQLKNRINKLMQDFIDNNCSGGTPVGVEAKKWINRPNPQPFEWKGPKLAEPTARSIWDWEYWEEVTGLTGAALVLYLIVSEGSRLYPPRNLVPVP